MQRTSEIGVRIALGAKLGDVRRLVLGKALRLTFLGAAVGSVGAFGVTRVLHSLAPGLQANTPLIMALVAGMVFGIALLACWVPARRATRLDPIVALRDE